MSPSLRSLLTENRLLRTFALGQLCHPKFVELVGLMGGYDALWFDQEHVGLTVPQLEEACRAARAVDLPCFVRLAATDYATVMRALEAGAGGVMAAMVKSASEAEQVAKWSRFHPQGQRGVNGSGVDGNFGLLPMTEYFQRANASIAVLIQIEHIDAVNDIDRIAATPGVDCLFIGPADLSQSMGLPGQWDHPEVWRAIERVATASRTHGVPWAILPISPAYARRCVELGCRMLSLGLDVWTIHRGVKATREMYAEFFPG